MNTPEEKRSIFDEAVARLKIAADAESENRIEGLRAIAFRDGEQWDSDIANQRKIENRPALTINHTNTFCARLKNQLRQQRPRIKCHPVGGGANKEDAEVVNGLMRHIETLSNASVAYDRGVESAIDIGWGYWRIVGEYMDPKSFDQELLIKPIRNTFTVYMDPSSVMPAGEDQQWCIISEVMKRDEYKRRYPKATNREWQADGPGDMNLNWENKEEIRIAEYYRINEVADTLYLMVDGSARLKSELPAPELMAAAGYVFAVDTEGQPISRPSARTQVEWYRLNGSDVVESRILPGRYIPVIRCEGNVLDVNGTVKRKGMVKDLMDPARMFNYWRTAETERYALAPKAPWVVAEGQIEGHPEWQTANQSSYSTLVYKPIAGPDGMTMLPPPMRQAPVQIEAGMAQAAAGAQSDLMSVAGMPQENPEIAARVVSGNKYLQRRQGMQDLTHFQYYDNQTLAIMWTGIILLDMIPHYYDTPRMQRIIGEDGVPEMVKINQPQQEGDDKGAIYRVKNNLQLGRYDVVMDTGPGYATKREEGAEAILGLLGTPLAEQISKVGADLIVRNMDFAGSDALADRLVPLNPEAMGKVIEGLPKQAQAIVGALQQQIKQHEQTIQQQAMEIKYRGSIEETRQKGQGMRTAAEIEAENERAAKRDATTRYVADVGSVTRRDVAEIGAAAQLLNAKAESDEEEPAAQRLIDAGTSKSS